jgi:HAD superfamily hydrolase (TIGR01484 family)
LRDIDTSTSASAPIRAVAFDLDGTILERGDVIADGVVAAITQLAALGIRTATATGRPLEFQLDLIARHGLDGADGFAALIADEREIFTRGATAGGYEPDRPWNDAIRARWAERLDEVLAWGARAVAEAARRGIAATLDPVEGRYGIAYRGLATLRFGGDDAAATEAAVQIDTWLAAQLADADTAAGLDLVCNRNRHIVQIADAAAGKANALARLAELWGLRPGEILALGDSINDVGMLGGTHGFRSATVADAAPEVRAAVRSNGGFQAAAGTGAGVLEALAALIPGLSAEFAPMTEGT